MRGLRVKEGPLQTERATTAEEAGCSYMGAFREEGAGSKAGPHP